MQGDQFIKNVENLTASPIKATEDSVFSLPRLGTVRISMPGFSHTSI